MTDTATTRGTLYALEQQRLATHGEQALRNAEGLMGELLGMNILPGILADILRVTRDDFTAAADTKAGTSAER